MNSQLIKLLNKLHLLETLNVHGQTVVNQQRFVVPILGKVGYSNTNISEPWMIDLLKLILRFEEHTFVDVGVNLGQSLIKLRSVSHKMPYLGFEPNPICVNYVTKLIKANTFTNTAVIPVGISSRNEVGVLNFYAESETDSSASAVDNFRPDQKIARKEFIPLFSVDAMNKDVPLDRVSILKIDVEGGELEVFQGFRPVLINSKPIILVEILPAYNDQNTARIQRQEAIQALMQELGFVMYRVVKENEQLVDLEQIQEIGIHSDINRCEYVAVHQDKLEAFQASMATFRSKDH